MPTNKENYVEYAAVILVSYMNEARTIGGYKTAVLSLPRVLQRHLITVDNPTNKDWRDSYTEFKRRSNWLAADFCHTLPCPQTKDQWDIANGLWAVGSYALGVNLSLRDELFRTIGGYGISDYEITIEKLLIAILGHGDAWIKEYKHRIKNTHPAVTGGLNTYGVNTFFHDLHHSRRLIDREGVVAAGLMFPTPEEYEGYKRVLCWAWAIEEYKPRRGGRTSYRVQRADIRGREGYRHYSDNFASIPYYWTNVPFKWLVANAHRTRTAISISDPELEKPDITVDIRMLKDGFGGGGWNFSRYSEVAGVHKGRVMRQLNSGRLSCVINEEFRHG